MPEERDLVISPPAAAVVAGRLAAALRVAEGRRVGQPRDR
jgi:hypothetical protein